VLPDEPGNGAAAATPDVFGASETVGEQSRLILARGKPAIRSMLAYLRFEQRTEPVVGVTCHPGSPEPLLSYEQLRGVVGSGVRVYLVPETALRRLEDGLGAALALPAQALRIWWPDLAGNPEHHPAIPVLEGESSEAILTEFARAFHLTHPLVREEIGRIEQLRIVAEHEAAEANQRAEQAGQRAREAQIARHAAELRASAAEVAAEPIDEMSTDLKLHALIAREWRKALTVQDRREYPLHYILSERFVDAVARRTNLDIERLAWGCAMVACGYAIAVKGLAPHHLLTGARGSSQRERDDGAKAWRCRAPGAQSGGAPRMHYWVLPNQTIEFHDLGEHDSLS